MMVGPDVQSEDEAEIRTITQYHFSCVSIMCVCINDPVCEHYVCLY